jgi:hypothetical protein
MGRDSVIGMATHYELDGYGIESQCGQGLLYPSRPALVPNEPPVQWELDLFPAGKAAEAWR